MRCPRPSKRSSMPWWTEPSRSILSPTPTSLSSPAVPCSSTPALTVVSRSSRLRVSSTTDSIPSRCSRCESSSPAGPPPTIPTCVRMCVAPPSLVTAVGQSQAPPMRPVGPPPSRQRGLRGAAEITGTSFQESPDRTTAAWADSRVDIYATSLTVGTTRSNYPCPSDLYYHHGQYRSLQNAGQPFCSTWLNGVVTYARAVTARVVRVSERSHLPSLRRPG